MPQVRASLLEVYNEEVRDLLSKQSKKPLDVREHRSSGVYVKGLTAIIVKSAAEIEKVLEVRIAPVTQVSSHAGPSQRIALLQLSIWAASSQHIFLPPRLERGIGLSARH